MAVIPAASIHATPYPTGWAWIDECRDILSGGTRAAVNRLQAPLVEADEELTVQFETNQPTVSSRLSVGLETMYVWDYSPAQRTVTVQRGVEGTQAEAHSAGDLVWVDPRFTTARIWRALQLEVNALSSEGLWRPVTLERTFDVTLGGVDLASNMLDTNLVNVVCLPAGMSGEWVEIPPTWTVLTDLSTEKYPSGRAVFFTEHGPSGSDRVRITYRAALDPLLDPGEDPCEATGLPGTAGDIPPIGAAIRLLAGEPITRANPSTSPTSRRPGETSTSDVLNSANALRASRLARLNEERTRLSRTYPTRVR